MRALNSFNIGVIVAGMILAVAVIVLSALVSIDVAAKVLFASAIFLVIAVIIEDVLSEGDDL